MTTLQGSLKEAAENFPNLSKMYDVYLASEKLGIHTRVDCVLIDESKKQAWPLQVKWAKKPEKLYRTYILQLLLEAALIEDQLGYAVAEGFVKFLKTGEIVKVYLQDKSELYEAISAIKNIISTETFPKPTEFKKRCTDCCYRKRCWAR